MVPGLLCLWHRPRKESGTVSWIYDGQASSQCTTTHRQIISMPICIPCNMHSLDIIGLCRSAYLPVVLQTGICLAYLSLVISMIRCSKLHLARGFGVVIVPREGEEAKSEEPERCPRGNVRMWFVKCIPMYSKIFQCRFD